MGTAQTRRRTVQAVSRLSLSAAIAFGVAGICVAGLFGLLDLFGIRLVWLFVIVTSLFSIMTTAGLVHFVAEQVLTITKP